MYHHDKIVNEAKSAKVSGGTFRMRSNKASSVPLLGKNLTKRNSSQNYNTASFFGNQHCEIGDYYVFLEEIGHGAYGTVVRAQKKLQAGQLSYETFAVKQINKKKAGAKGLKEVYGEVETLMLLKHENIVRLEETFEDEENLYIVMEYLAGGELATAITEAKEKRNSVKYSTPHLYPQSHLSSGSSVEHSHDSLSQPSRSSRHTTSLSSSTASLICGGGLFPENTVRKMVMYILLALQYIHAKGFAHRDLKPANCLLSNPGEPLLKIADFGFAVLTGSEECLSSYCGTTAYMAPEILRNTTYGKGVDMWALGVMVYQLLSGDLPFTIHGNVGGKGVNSNDSEDLVDVICNGKVVFSTKIWYSVTPSAKDFVRRLLEPDSSKRASATECLAHQWLQPVMSFDRNYSLSGDLSVNDDVNGLEDGNCMMRSTKIMFKGAVIAVLAAHRLLFWSKCKMLKMEGADNPKVRCFSFLVGNSYRPPKVLDCSGQFIGQPNSLTAFLRMVEVAFTVETLDLSRNEIDLDLGQLLVKSLIRHPSIVHLILDNNPLPPLIGRSLVRLARASTNRIRTISLVNTQIPNELIKHINDTLKETEESKKANCTSNHSKSIIHRSFGFNNASNRSGRTDIGMVKMVKCINVSIPYDNGFNRRRSQILERNGYDKLHTLPLTSPRDEPVYPPHFTGFGQSKKRSPLTIRPFQSFSKLPPLPTVSSLTANALENRQ